LERSGVRPATLLEGDEAEASLYRERRVRMRRALLLLAVMTAALVVVSGVAFAVVIDGTAGDDTI
jgi:hypothetical protein